MPFEENDDQHHEDEAVDADTLGDEDEDLDDDSEENFGRHGFHVEGEEEEPSDLL
jgi:hypothetical protein